MLHKGCYVLPAAKWLFFKWHLDPDGSRCGQHDASLQSSPVTSHWLFYVHGDICIDPLFLYYKDVIF